MMRFSPVPLLFIAISVALGQVSPDINSQPSREFGHAKLTLEQQTTSPNLLEGRELNSPTAVAFDTSVSPPIVYVADTGNHRVLAWRNPASLTVGNQADKVIGQRDFFRSFTGGPGSTSGGLTAAGMTLPSSIAVDGSGNLWVFDAGNNRILRYPRPLEQQGDFVTPDVVIGQKTVSVGNQPNEGLTKPSEKTIASNRFGTARGALTFDADGNLWVADPLNNRVLRFPKSRLNSNEPAADIVLGQQTFDSDATGNTQIDLTVINRPAALSFDSRGGLYVSDALIRVLYYNPPSLNTGSPANRILGVQPTTGTRPPAPNDYTVGQTASGGFNIAQCVVTIGNAPYICDTPANRIVRFASSDTWPAASPTVVSPQIQGVFGQPNLLSGGVNRGNGPSKADSNTLNGPSGAAVWNNEIWVADAGNNRVLALPATGNLDLNPASRVLGQIGFDLNSINLVDGRELYMFDPNFHATGLAIDRTSTPNRLYVADTFNNRVLGFKDVRTVGTDVRTLLTQTADLIIGQPDRFRTGINYPSGDAQIPTDQGLFLPTSVAVDAQGNLWVADSQNGRILRFPSPFSVASGQPQRATLVLGQSTFSSKITDASSSTMSLPTGVTVFNNGDVAAADYNLNRILLFRRSGSDFVNGQNARAVLGQPNFSSSVPGTSSAQLYRPKGLAVDTSDRLYVADSGNFRVVVYSSTSTIGNGAAGTSIPNLNVPESVAVSPSTGEVWVSAFNDNRVYRFREFTQLGQNPTPTASVGSPGPMGIVLDQFDNLIVAEASNRMTFYFAKMVYRHAATYASGSNIAATMTPGMYALIGRSGKDFEFTPASGSIPYPKTLGGLQVLVNGTPAPITSITPSLIYFLVPNNAPTSGDAEYLLTRPETGEILAAGSFTMGPAAPGFFTANQQGNRQIAATNENGSPNGITNPIGQNQLLTLWLTGYGHLDNAPPDGEAAGRAIDTDVKPVVIIGGTYRVPDSKILYSGLSPQFPGLWQVNIRMPQNGEAGAPLPSNNVSILVLMRDVPSNIAPTNVFGVDQPMTVPNGLITTIAFK